MRNNINSLIVCGLFVSCLLMASQSTASSTILSNKDLKRLPQFCTAKMRSHTMSPAEVDFWERKLGSSYLDIHHYCFALHYRLIAQQEKNKIDQKYFYERVIGNTNYILEGVRAYNDPSYFNTTAESVGFSRFMLLRMLTEAFIGLGYEQKAEENVQRLLEEEQNNIRAQLYAFDFYFERKMFTKCQSVITNASSMDQLHKGITRRVERLSFATQNKIK